MNLRLLFCIGMGVFTTYIGLVMLIGHYRAPKSASAPSLKPNFSAHTEQQIDAETGEKVTNQEFTVSTKLAGEPGIQPDAR